jgi:prepilin peptidase CpaA
MSSSVYASELVLIATAVVLFYVAHNDLRHYKIRNELIAVLAALCFIHATVSGRWIELQWNIAFAAVMFVAMLVLYAQRLMGGGDVKLLAVAFLWVGIGCALPFAVLLLLFAGLHVLASRLGWVPTRAAEGDERPRIPFAPSVAAALIGVFMLGCLAPTG